MPDNEIMIGKYRYGLYLEYDSEEDKAAGTHNGNVTALYLDNGTFLDGAAGVCWEAATGVYGHPNSACCSGSVSQHWLDDRTEPIDEVRAREIHPALFDYLEAAE